MYMNMPLRSASDENVLPISLIDRREISFLQMKFHASGFQSRKVQYLVGQILQTLCISHASEGNLLVLRIVFDILQFFFQRADD